MTRICNTIESNNFGHYVFIQIVTTFAPKFCMKTSYPKENIKILLLEGVSPTATALFEKAGYSDIESLPKAISEEALIERLQDGVHLLGIRSKTQLTAKVLSNAPHLWAVGCFCIGTNQVDLRYASQKGIAVFNSPYSNTRSVAELTIGEMIMLLRHIPEKNAAAHQGAWLKDAANCYELRGKTLGIIGYGHIGSQVSVMAEALGMRVLYYDIVPKLPMGNAIATNSLDELLSLADVVSLHVPADASTKNMFDKQIIGQMKQGSILLNLSRGSVVDIDALADALENGHLQGAGIDVFPHEPAGKHEQFVSRLQNLPNVILTPHIGGSTIEAQDNIGRDAATKMIQYMDKGVSVGSHSIPELSLPVHQSAQRILHIHQNVPGVLSAINQIISQQQLNIVGQYLNTKGDVGYVVLDVESQEKGLDIGALRQLPQTIKVRWLY
jgi:D-3-phosphoglycerate dehydrogenase